jgi:hypothetical protein
MPPSTPPWLEAPRCCLTAATSALVPRPAPPAAQRCAAALRCAAAQPKGTAAGTRRRLMKQAPPPAPGEPEREATFGCSVAEAAIAVVRRDRS